LKGRRKGSRDTADTGGGPEGKRRITGIRRRAPNLAWDTITEACREKTTLGKRKVTQCRSGRE